MTQTLFRHLRITGRVQGVGYRRALCAEAERRGLAGWVRNRHDGSVEALVCGNAENVEALTVWAHSGPPAARVDNVASEDLADAAGDALHGFIQRPTG